MKLTAFEVTDENPFITGNLTAQVVLTKCNPAKAAELHRRAKADLTAAKERKPAQPNLTEQAQNAVAIAKECQRLATNLPAGELQTELARVARELVGRRL